jgi:hypothetical protein
MYLFRALFFWGGEGGAFKFSFQFSLHSSLTAHVCGADELAGVRGPADDQQEAQEGRHRRL